MCFADSMCLSRTALSLPSPARNWLCRNVFLWAFSGFSSGSGSMGIGVLVSVSVVLMSISQCKKNAGLEMPITQKSAVAFIFRIVVLRWLIGVFMMSAVVW